MAKIPSPCPNFPKARIARSPDRSFKHILRRRWLGRSELAALSMAAGIMLLMGGVLAGFAAANPNGVALPERAEAEAAPTASSTCTTVPRSNQSCATKWELAMAGAELGSWDAARDWEEAHCHQYSEVCVEPDEGWE